VLYQGANGSPWPACIILIAILNDEFSMLDLFIMALLGSWPFI